MLIIDCAVSHNSLKFLRHLWIVQNQIQNFSRKTKINISETDSNVNKNKKIKTAKRRSLLSLNLSKNTNSDNFKGGFKLIDLTYLIKNFADSRRQSSIK
jgi:hypothetical protein